MAKKITDYPNEATSFSDDDKFDVSQKLGGPYESKWYSKQTLFFEVLNAAREEGFISTFTMDRATIINAMTTSNLQPFSRYIVTDSAVTGGREIAMFSISPNKLTDFAYIMRPQTGIISPFEPNPVCNYDVVGDVIRYNDFLTQDLWTELALRYGGGYFVAGQTIEITDAAQGKVRVVSNGPNKTSAAAVLLGEQDGGTNPTQLGYHGNYDAGNDVFVHDIVHFRQEVTAAQINTASAFTAFPIAQCPTPPAGYAWEVLSANVDRKAGSDYGANPLLGVGFQSLGRAQFWDLGNHILKLATAQWRQLITNNQTSNTTIVADEKLSVLIQSVTATGSGDIVVHGTARLMKH